MPKEEGTWVDPEVEEKASFEIYEYRNGLVALSASS
jgi:hypothetical protein